MNTRKFIPILLPAFFAAIAFYACDTTKTTASGTPGSPRDTTSVQPVKTSKSPKLMSAAASGTPGSPRDTTSIKKN